MRTDIVGAYGHEIVGDVDGDFDGDDFVGDFDGDIDGDFDGDVDGADFDGDDSGAFNRNVLAGDMESMMGAAKRRRRKRSARQRQIMAARAAALANRRVQEGAILQDVNPTKAREYILGFDSTSVPGSTSANITKRPQVIFRPERVVIPSAVGIDFQVVDIKVGKNSQFSASGEVPAVVFSETSFGVRLKMDTAQVSMDVTISIRNTNAAQRNFTAAIIGPAVE
jgi:hypothetical protein